MRHEPECDRAAHIDYQDGSDPGPCNTAPITAAAVSAWGRYGRAGAVVVFDGLPAAVLSPVEFASFCVRGIELAARLGAVPPAQRRPSGPQV